MLFPNQFLSDLPSILLQKAHPLTHLLNLNFHLSFFHFAHQTFPEMLQLLQDCKFHNCKHINEPGCEVLNQLSKNNFSMTRHQSYLAMYQEDKDSNYRKNNYL